MLKLYSLQRRHDRYTIIYVWKILESIVPNLNIPITYYIDKIRYSFIRQKEPIQTVNNNIQLLHNVTIQLHGCRKK